MHLTRNYFSMLHLPNFGLHDISLQITYVLFFTGLTKWYWRVFFIVIAFAKRETRAFSSFSCNSLVQKSKSMFLKKLLAQSNRFLGVIIWLFTGRCKLARRALLLFHQFHRKHLYCATLQKNSIQLQFSHTFLNI